jgi:3',5'-cyclic AMP phosphodiesterase CpdA
MLDYSTVQYIDSLFDLGNPETHWALGNHDARNGNWEWYEEFTGRESFYTYSSHGITRVVMNTNLVPTDCEKMNAQYHMILDACDTIQSGNTLILLMHHGIWISLPGCPQPWSYAQSNLKYWNSNCYDVTSGFKESIYPKLVEAHNRGVKVIGVLGDMGVSDKSIDFKSSDGIHFLGCGLYHNEPEDRVLIFTKNLYSGVLDYKYHNLDSLLLAQ